MQNKYIKYDLNNLILMNKKINETTKNEYTSKFNFKNLINEKKKKIDIANEYYNKYYELCLRKIEYANKLNYEYITFQVPTNIIECSTYDYNKCKEFICENIKKKSLDIYMLNNDIIYISWNNLINKNIL
jgi:hypothetical protein